MPSSSKKRKNGQLKGLFREIFVCGNQELAPFGTVFVFPPENFEQQKLGTLFGIIKISDTSADSSYVSNLLTSVIKKEFFSKSDRSTESSFEASLRKANLALAELTRQGSTKWSGKINFAGGVLEKNNLHFAKLGATSVLLLRNGMVADIGSGMGADSSQPDLHPLKTFSDISSGKLEKKDRLIFATNDLLEIFSLEEMKQNAARFPYEEFVEILSASLSANSDLSGAIVASLVAEEVAEIPLEAEEIVKVPAPPQEDYARPAVAPEPKEKTTLPKPSPHVDIPPVGITAPQRPEKPNHLYVSEGEEIIPKKTFLKKIISSSKALASNLKSFLAGFWKKAAPFLRNANWKEKATSLYSFFSRIYEGLKNFDWKSKNSRIALGFVGLVAIVTLVAFLRFSSNTNPPETVQTAPENPPVVSLDDIQVKNIEKIEEVATLPQDSRKIVLFSGSLFSLSGDKSIIKVDPGNNSTEQSDTDIAGGKFSLAAAMPDLGTIFILTEDKKIISYTPNNKGFQENGIALSDSLNATDMKAYLTYLYILDAEANQIYRYPRAEGGFGERQDWLKSGADIKNSISFGINEDIFTASNSQITAYLQGKVDGNINFESPSNSLLIDKFYTAPDLENIYVLDNKNHRVLQYSKEGKIIAQFFNSSLAGIKDFTVDEKNKVVYLQKTGSVLKFSMD